MTSVTTGRPVRAPRVHQDLERTAYRLERRTDWCAASRRRRAARARQPAFAACAVSRTNSGRLGSIVQWPAITNSSSPSVTPPIRNRPVGQIRPPVHQLERRLDPVDPVDEVQPFEPVDHQLVAFVADDGVDRAQISPTIGCTRQPNSVTISVTVASCSGVRRLDLGRIMMRWSHDYGRRVLMGATGWCGEGETSRCCRSFRSSWSWSGRFSGCHKCCWYRGTREALTPTILKC